MASSVAERAAMAGGDSSVAGHGGGGGTCPYLVVGNTLYMCMYLVNSRGTFFRALFRTFHGRLRDELSTVGRQRKCYAAP